MPVSIQTLKMLYLDSNIGVEGAVAFRTALKQNNSLTKLELSSNNIGSDGARQLAAALERNCTLTALSLYDNDIGDWCFSDRPGNQLYP